ncbi:hypothetical protein ACWF0M_12710 [Kribbella sp. NPDC055110]
MDELGYMYLDRRGAELLLEVLTEREEKNSDATRSPRTSRSPAAANIHRPKTLCRHRRPPDLRPPDERVWAISSRPEPTPSGSPTALTSNPYADRTDDSELKRPRTPEPPKRQVTANGRRTRVAPGGGARSNMPVGAAQRVLSRP